MSFLGLFQFLEKNLLSRVTTCFVLPCISESPLILNSRRIENKIPICRSSAANTVRYLMCLPRDFLSKLNTYGIRGITLDGFSSCLTIWEQYVYVHTMLANLKDIQCGVPQGSILGPLLVLIFIKFNDITQCPNQFKYISTLSTCVPGDNIMQSAGLINNELKCLNWWLKLNKISINARKTKYMLFSYNKNVNLSIITIDNKKK